MTFRLKSPPIFLWFGITTGIAMFTDLAMREFTTRRHSLLRADTTRIPSRSYALSSGRLRSILVDCRRSPTASEVSTVRCSTAARCLAQESLSALPSTVMAKSRAPRASMWTSTLTDTVCLSTLLAFRMASNIVSKLRNMEGHISRPIELCALRLLQYLKEPIFGL